jgi:hypothetical protein
VLNQPYTAYTGQRVAGAGQMNPFASNAYADQLVRQTTGDITNAYQQGVQPSLMAQFNAGGAYGGSAHLQALQGSQDAYAHQLAEASTGIRGQQADAQRDAWTQMMGRNQAADDAGYQQYVDQRDFQANRLGLMSNALASIKGGTSNGSQTGANPNYRSASQNTATYAAILASMFGS